MVCLILVWFANPAKAEENKMSTASESYGNITLEGPTGMFLNPTSATLKKDMFIVQYCAAILKFKNNNTVDHYAIASYGLTDWFELGALGRIWDLNDSPAHDVTPSGGGPFARLRILQEKKLIPEFSIGGSTVRGDDLIRKDMIFFAASKGLGLKERNLPIDVRIHAGVRQFWFGTGNTFTRTWFNMTPDVGGSGINDHVGYGGGEIALPKNIYLVSEVSTKPMGAFKTPYSVGAQLRSPEGYGISLAGIQTGSQDKMGIFIGIGINFN